MLSLVSHAARLSGPRIVSTSHRLSLPFHCPALAVSSLCASRTVLHQHRVFARHASSSATPSRSLKDIEAQIQSGTPEALERALSDLASLATSSSARADAAAKRLAQLYHTLDAQQRESFLRTLATDLSLSHDVAKRAVTAYSSALEAESAEQSATSPIAHEDAIAYAAGAARDALTPLYTKLLRLLVRCVPDALPLMVQWRADLLGSTELGEHTYAALSVLDAATAAALERVARSDAVHPMHGDLQTLRQRLAPPHRRIYALEHTSAPTEPLVFVEVALMNQIPASMPELWQASAPDSVGASLPFDINTAGMMVRPSASAPASSSSQRVTPITARGGMRATPPSTAAAPAPPPPEATTAPLTPPSEATPPASPPSQQPPSAAAPPSSSSKRDKKIIRTTNLHNNNNMDDDAGGAADLSLTTPVVFASIPSSALPFDRATEIPLTTDSAVLSALTGSTHQPTIIIHAPPTTAGAAATATVLQAEEGALYPQKPSSSSSAAATAVPPSHTSSASSSSSDSPPSASVTMTHTTANTATTTTTTATKIINDTTIHVSSRTTSQHAHFAVQSNKNTDSSAPGSDTVIDSTTSGKANDSDTSRNDNNSSTTTVPTFSASSSFVSPPLPFTSSFSSSSTPTAPAAASFDFGASHSSSAAKLSAATPASSSASTAPSPTSSSLSSSSSPSSPSPPPSSATSSSSPSPSVAAFYSINTTHNGLQGVDMGNLLMKSVMQALSAELESSEQKATFVTLSPIPGFRRWLESKLITADADADAVDPARSLLPVGDDATAFYDRLRGDGWLRDGGKDNNVREVLTRLCAFYLLRVRRRDTTALGVSVSAAENAESQVRANPFHTGLPADSVASFHLRNGAQLFRINWLADRSPRRIHESFGLMANYRYPSDEEERVRNAEQYSKHGLVAASHQVVQLLPQMPSASPLSSFPAKRSSAPTMHDS